LARDFSPNLILLVLQVGIIVLKQNPAEPLLIVKLPMNLLNQVKELFYIRLSDIRNGSQRERSGSRRGFFVSGIGTRLINFYFCQPNMNLYNSPRTTIHQHIRSWLIHFILILFPKNFPKRKTNTVKAFVLNNMRSLWVELRGVEPRSKRGSNTLSTCLSKI
jgi:hypothetical protein